MVIVICWRFFRIFRINIFRSSWIRYELLNMRMNRYILLFWPIFDTHLIMIKSSRITFTGSTKYIFLLPSWCITQFWHWIVTTKSIDLVPIWLVVSIIFIRYNFPRYFRKSKRISKIETFIRQSKLGDWSVDVNMFLSRGGERNGFLKVADWLFRVGFGKVSSQFQCNCEQSYFWREIKARRSISTGFTSTK